jgi:hypothetical protein
MTKSIWKEQVTSLWLSEPRDLKRQKEECAVPWQKEWKRRTVHFMSYFFIPFLRISCLCTVVTLLNYMVCTEYALYLRCHTYSKQVTTPRPTSLSHMPPSNSLSNTTLTDNFGKFRRPLGVEVISYSYSLAAVFISYSREAHSSQVKQIILTHRKWEISKTHVVT